MIEIEEQVWINKRCLIEYEHNVSDLSVRGAQYEEFTSLQKENTSLENILLD
jgi:hypothetical protein